MKTSSILKQGPAYIAALALLSLSGVTHAQDAYRDGVAGAKAKAAEMKAAEQKRDAEEAAKKQAAAEAARKAQIERDRQQHGTGEQKTVPGQAVYSGRAN